MERVRINLRDQQFGMSEDSDISGSNHLIHNDHIEWVTTNELVSNTCVFTDLCFPDVLKCKPGIIKRKVAWMHEPRSIYAHTYDWITANNRLFDFVLCYDKQLLDRGENFLYAPNLTTYIRFYKNEEKTKLCSIFASPKRFTDGHQMRHAVIDQFKDKYKFDSFGQEYNHVEIVETGLSEYMYSITIENSVQDYYSSEKLVNCLSTRTIPIYRGSKSNVLRHFNPDGVIFFNTIDELEDILSNMSAEQYKSMLPAIEDNFNRVQEFNVSENWIFKTYPFLFD